MRIRLGFLAVILCSAQVAWGQQAATLDPYEVLYGRRLTFPRRPIPEAALVLPKRTALLVQARTDLLLNQLRRTTATVGTRYADPSIKEVADLLQQEHAKLLYQRTQGRPLATLWHASALFLVTAFLGSFFDAILREPPADVSSELESPSRLPELRARLDAFRTRIFLIQPQNAAVALAIAEAHVAWVDMSSLLDLLQKRPSEFYRLLVTIKEISPEARDRFMRRIVEPIAFPVVDWWLDEAELFLQASLAEQTTQPLRLEESAIRELARRYQDVASVNIKLLASRARNQSSAKRDAVDQFTSSLTTLLIVQRIEYGQQHRDDPGLDAAFTVLGTSFAAYRNTLAAQEILEIETAPIVSDDEARNTAEKAQAETRQSLLNTEYLRARQAAALAQSALGSVPTPVVLATQLGRELREEADDGQDAALEEFIDAQAMAQLSIALIKPSPGRASRGTTGLLPGPSEKEQEEAVLLCIESLRDPTSGVFAKAVGYAYGHDWRVRGGALRQLVDDAIASTCAQARFLNANISWYFWRIYKNEYVNWLRAEVNEQADSRLAQSCPDTAPSPENDLLDREQCALRSQAIEQLSTSDRELIGWFIDDGMSLLEISGRKNITYDAARMRVTRALSRFRQAYQELAAISLRLPGLQDPWFFPKRALWAAWQAPVSDNFRRKNAALSFF